MESQWIEPVSEVAVRGEMPGSPPWVANAAILWEHRRLLGYALLISIGAGLLTAFVIPKKFTSTGRIMPPDNAGSSLAMFAALAGRNTGEMGGLGSLAGSLLGMRNSSALFVDLLRSGTVSGHLVDRFQLQHAWHKRYRVDAAKYLARHTTITDDKRSGVITVEVEDTDPRRARDLAQAYLDELNLLVVRTSTSSARQERIFIEHRLHGAEVDLKEAQVALSDFSSQHTTIDISEQTRAMVDAGARLQAEEIAAQSEVDSLRQIYGDSNVRVRAAKARTGELQRQLQKMSGSPSPSGTGSEDAAQELYPPLRQLPGLSVPYSELYRRVRVQSALYELLTQQYEMARIQEAKDIPVVSVIDAPGIPEKKSFPPRLLVASVITILGFGGTVAFIFYRRRWRFLDEGDPRKLLAADVAMTMGRFFDRREKAKEASREC